MNIILDKLFVSHQFNWVGIVKFDDAFPGLRSNKFLNSLYITLWTLEICFSLCWILGSHEKLNVYTLFSSLSQTFFLKKNNQFFYSLS